MAALSIPLGRLARLDVLKRRGRAVETKVPHHHQIIRLTLKSLSSRPENIQNIEESSNNIVKMKSNNSASPYDSYPFISNPENPCEAEKKAEEFLDFLYSQLPEGLTGEERVAKWHELQLQYDDMEFNLILDQLPDEELAFHQAEAAAHPDGLSAQLLRMGPVMHDDDCINRSWRISKTP